MKLNEMVGTAELVLRVLQKCAERGSITTGERALLAEYAGELGQQLGAESKEERVNSKPAAAVVEVSSQQSAVTNKEIVAVVEKPVEIVKSVEVEKPVEVVVEEPVKVVVEEPVEPELEPILNPQSSILNSDEEEETLIVLPGFNRDAVRELYKTEAEDRRQETEESKEEEVVTVEVEQIINDLIPPKDVNSSVQAGVSLTQLIGINDRFIITRDLFGGDTFAYNRTILTLDNFSDPDEALLYLHKTYNWDASSDGCQLLIEKLMQKLS